MTLQHWNSVDTLEIFCMLISKLPGNTEIDGTERF